MGTSMRAVRVRVRSSGSGSPAYDETNAKRELPTFLPTYARTYGKRK